ncbi:M50 family metallopeptidase [Lachnospiraceae bacterium ZAX-1]
MGFAVFGMIFFFVFEKKEISLNMFSCELIICLEISIVFHEFGHFVVGKYCGYSLLCMRALGLQMTFCPNNLKKFKIKFDMKWMLSGNVVFDYHAYIKLEKSLNVFL